MALNSKTLLKTSVGIVLLLVTVIYSSTGENPHLYVTWENSMEIDKLSSAWVIKRFIDKEAQFKFIAKGEIITEGIAYDTPDAELRRYQTLACLEYILKKYNLKDPVLLKLGGLVHDLEINTWGPKKYPESIKMSEKMQQLKKASDSDVEVLEKGFKWLDEWYRSEKENP